MRGARWAVILVGLLLPGCRFDEARMLRAERIVALDGDGATTLAVDTSGRFWLGQPGELMIRDSTGVIALIALPGAGIPSVVGAVEAGTVVRQDSALFLVRADARHPVDAIGPRVGVDPVIVDVRGRNVLEAARSGAVLAYDAVTLEARSAWAALGAASTALAESAEGDRIYQAVSDGEGANRILIRDAQTGRILGAQQFPAVVVALARGADRSLFGMMRSGERLDVVALQPVEQRLETRWRRSFEIADGDAAISMAVAGGGVAVWGPGTERLHLLAASDGSTVGRTAETSLDAAPGLRGELWVLRPGSLRLLY